MNVSKLCVFARKECTIITFNFNKWMSKSLIFLFWICEVCQVYFFSGKALETIIIIPMDIIILFKITYIKELFVMQYFIYQNT